MVGGKALPLHCEFTSELCSMSLLLRRQLLGILLLLGVEHGSQRLLLALALGSRVLLLCGQLCGQLVGRGLQLSILIDGLSLLCCLRLLCCLVLLCRLGLLCCLGLLLCLLVQLHPPNHSLLGLVVCKDAN